MIRSTTTSSAFRIFCLGACLLGAPATSSAGPDDAPSIQSNNSPPAEPDVYSGPDGSASTEIQSSAQEQIAAKPLPPRSTQPGSTVSTGDRTSFHMPDGAWRTIGALGVVVGLIVLLRTVMTRFSGPLGRARAPAGIVEVLGRFPLARTQTLLLLKVDRRILLLAQTPQGLTTLSEMSDAEQVASLVQRIRNDRGDSFSRQFERLITPVGSAAEPAEPTPVVIDLTKSRKASAAQRVASMLADGGRR